MLISGSLRLVRSVVGWVGVVGSGSGWVVRGVVGLEEGLEPVRFVAGRLRLVGSGVGSGEG